MFSRGLWTEKRIFWISVLAAALATMAVYLGTLCPTIFVGDSGELVAGSFCLGIVHPPGYPLYCMLGRLLALIPVGSVAWRLNLLSALGAVLSALLTALLTASLVQRTWAGAGSPVHKSALVAGGAGLAGLLVAFSRTLWSQAVVAEVYSLNLLFLLLCLGALSRWRQGQGRYLWLFAFLFGLSLSHHPTALLAIPAYGAYLAWHRQRLFEKKIHLFVALIFVALGLTVWLYLPLRSRALPAYDWGHPVSLGQAWAHITRATYGSLSKTPRSWGLLGWQLQAFFRLAGGQFGPALAAVGLVGWAVLLRRAADWAFLTMALLVGYGLGVILLLNFPVTPRDLSLVQVFFIPAFAALAIWAGLGAVWLVSGLIRLMALAGLRCPRAFGPALGCLLMLLSAVPLARNFAANDRSGQFLVADLGNNILATVEPGSVLVTSRDTPTFSLAHARIVAGIRPDVSLWHVGRANVFRSLDPPVERLEPGNRPIYGVSLTDLPVSPGWSPHQVGIVYQLRREPLPTERLLAAWQGYTLRNFQDEGRQDDFLLAELIGNYAAARGNLAQELARRGELDLALQEARQAVTIDASFYGAHLSLGNVLFQSGDYPQAERTYLRALALAPDRAEILDNLALTQLKMGHAEGAIRLYRQSLALHPDRAITYNQLGLAYKQAGLYDQASQAYRRALQLDPEYADPLRNLGVILAYHLVDVAAAIELWERYLNLRPDDPQADEIRAEIERMENRPQSH